MRKAATLLLVVYSLITAYVTLRALAGLPFQFLWAILLPLLALGFSLTHAGAWLGWRGTLLFLALTLVITTTFEHLSVRTGWIYGSYSYGSRFGPLIFGTVPVLVPLTWYMMLYPSFVISQRLVIRFVGQSFAGRWIFIAAVSGLVMTAWDLVLDPLMVSRGHWTWNQPGGYFGVPAQNYLGWWLTSAIITSLFLVLRRGERFQLTGSFSRLPAILYGVVGLGNVADAWLSGMQAPALAGLFAMLPWALLALVARDEAG